MTNHQNNTVEMKKQDMLSVIEKINGIKKKINQLKEKSGYKQDDARNQIYVFLNMKLQNFQVGIKLSKQLENPKFFEKKEREEVTDDIEKSQLESPESEEEGIKEVTDDVKKMLQGEFINFLANAFFFLFFFQIENYIRLITDSIGIGKRGGSIKKIFRELVTEYSLSKDYEDLFNIIVNIRNSCHNGGFYMGNDETIVYKGKEYKFTNGQVIKFEEGIIDAYVFLLEEMLGLIEELNNKTKGESYIKHNYSDINFTYEE